MSSYVFGATLFLFAAKIKTPTLLVKVETDDQSHRLDFVYANRITIDMNNNRFVLAYTSLMYAYCIADDGTHGVEHLFVWTFYLCIA